MTGGLTWGAASTTSPWCGRYGQQITTTERNFNFTRAATSVMDFFPTIGSWVHYGLGSLNENLPQFVVMGEPINVCCCGGPQVHLANYLGAEHDGIMINEKEPLPYGNPAGRISFKKNKQPTWS